MSRAQTTATTGLTTTEPQQLTTSITRSVPSHDTETETVLQPSETTTILAETTKALTHSTVFTTATAVLAQSTISRTTLRSPPLTQFTATPPTASHTPATLTLAQLEKKTLTTPIQPATTLSTTTTTLAGPKILHSPTTQLTATSSGLEPVAKCAKTSQQILNAGTSQRMVKKGLFNTTSSRFLC